jgi:hypothetical protein
MRIRIAVACQLGAANATRQPVPAATHLWHVLRMPQRRARGPSDVRRCRRGLRGMSRGRRFCGRLFHECAARCHALSAPRQASPCVLPGMPHKHWKLRDRGHCADRANTHAVRSQHRLSLRRSLRAACRPRRSGSVRSGHVVDGWNPSTYSRAAHEKLRLPLEGRHAQIPCASCHAPTRAGLPECIANTFTRDGAHGVARGRVAVRFLSRDSPWGPLCWVGSFRNRCTLYGLSQRHVVEAIDCRCGRTQPVCIRTRWRASSGGVRCVSRGDEGTACHVNTRAVIAWNAKPAVRTSPRAKL